MPGPAATYREAYESFAWRIPARYNIARDVVDRHAAAAPENPALIHEDGDGRVRTYSFRDIQRLANRCANTLRAHGVRAGDRVAILLGQVPEAAFAHVACYKLGAIAMPLSTLFGEEALAYRLTNGGPKAALTDRASYPKLAVLRPSLPGLETMLLIDGADSGALDLHAEMAKASDTFSNAATRAEDPALLVYTSGTTGPPKGALHAHRAMLGHMPGFDLGHERFGQDGDLAWTHADWAWLAGLMNLLMPAWWHGKPVLACRTGKLDPERAYHLIARHGVRNALLVPTMLRMMRQVAEPPATNLRTLLIGGEPAGEELHAWARSRFGISVNEGFGQTECNAVLVHAPALMPARHGSLGLPAPGHVGAVVDDSGSELPAGVQGHIAFRRPDPVMLLEYWREPAATRAKFAGDWLLTGDEGVRDDEGYFWLVGRVDDVITSAGYRIGPGEIEHCLERHPAVAMAAAVGVPDPLRTEIVKAFVVLADGWRPSPELEDEIRSFVRERLAAHLYPREIEFAPDLPRTATGKIMRRVLREREIERLGRISAL